jgi:hypothetical protein
MLIFQMLPKFHTVVFEIDAVTLSASVRVETVRDTLGEMREI